jgi:hypothetical protein
LPKENWQLVLLHIKVSLNYKLRWRKSNLLKFQQIKKASRRFCLLLGSRNSTQVGDEGCSVYGLLNVQYGELVEFDNGLAIVLNLEEYRNAGGGIHQQGIKGRFNSNVATNVRLFLKAESNGDGSNSNRSLKWKGPTGDLCEMP